MSASEEVAQKIDQTSSKKTPKQNARRWSDEETDRLIDLLEGNRCLWDVFCADYHLKDKRERAYSSIEEELNISVSDIRNKIVGLRFQLARELQCVSCLIKDVECMFGIVWPPPNFQHVALSNMQPTCWIVQYLSFGRVLRHWNSCNISLIRV